MAGQGKTTRKYADRLAEEGWNILYVCIPNTPHVKVVPIPTSHGVSKQRYPDVAAVNNDRILLAEVEMSLTESVAQDIGLRFNEMRRALENPEIYRAWSSRAEMVSKHKMPANPIIETRLKLVNGIGQKTSHLVDYLRAEGIVISGD
jgi:hypothetical protein